MGRSLRVRAALSGMTAVVLGLALVGPALAHKPGPSIKVVADGLNQPRGLDVTADGRIYVADFGDWSSFGGGGAICALDPLEVKPK